MKYILLLIMMVGILLMINKKEMVEKYNQVEYQIQECVYQEVEQLKIAEDLKLKNFSLSDKFMEIEKRTEVNISSKEKYIIISSCIYNLYF